MRKLFRKTDEEVNIILVVVAILTVLGIVILGFGSTIADITECKSTVTKYVEAKYRDWEGDTYYEVASDIRTVVTVNGELYATNVDSKYIRDVGNKFIPVMPTAWGEMKSHRDFKEFKYRTDSSVKVTSKIFNETEPNVFTTGTHNYAKCLRALGSKRFIKTWYGISYEGEF